MSFGLNEYRSPHNVGFGYALNGTAKRATLHRLSNHFVAYRVKDGLFKGYLIMDSRWSFMERQEFMKIVDEAQNTMK